jgi:hypothetical protein
MGRETKICTRRRGHGSQRSYVIDLQNLTEIEILEFDRRLEGAPQGNFGNWKVPTTYAKSRGYPGRFSAPFFGNAPADSRTWEHRGVWPMLPGRRGAVPL